MEKYWRKTVALTVSLLAVWFVVGFGLAIFAAPWLNQFTFLGGPLGFWVGQNGAIYIFVLLILVYGLAMNKLDDSL